MKRYNVTTSAGKSYVLAGLEDGVKEQIEDIVQADERTRLHRQLKKGLITTEVYTMEKSGVQAMSFDSEACIKFCTAQSKGQRKLIELLLIAGGKCPEPTEADIDAIHDDYGEEGSPVNETFVKIWEDAIPKKKTVTKLSPPASTDTADESTGVAS